MATTQEGDKTYCYLHLRGKPILGVFSLGEDGLRLILLGEFPPFLGKMGFRPAFFGEGRLMDNGK
jgi:hypothetical protein